MSHNIFLYLLFVLMVGCAQPSTNIDIDSYIDDESYLYSSSVISIAELKNRYLGSSHPIVDDVVIEGRVVANDMYGEFYKVLIIEDSSAAIEVRIDSYDLYDSYPIGALISVVCDDLWLSSRGGTVIVGAEPTSGDYLLGYISDELLLSSVILSDDDVQSVEPTEVTLSQLDVSMISRCVLLRDLEFTDTAGLTFVQRDDASGHFVDTYHTLCDRYGDDIELVVSSLATYAEVALPRGIVDLWAVVEYSSGEFYLRITSFMITL